MANADAVASTKDGSDQQQLNNSAKGDSANKEVQDASKQASTSWKAQPLESSVSAVDTSGKSDMYKSLDDVLPSQTTNPSGDATNAISNIQHEAQNMQALFDDSAHLMSDVFSAVQQADLSTATGQKMLKSSLDFAGAILNMEGAALDSFGQMLKGNSGNHSQQPETGGGTDHAGPAGSHSDDHGSHGGSGTDHAQQDDGAHEHSSGHGTEHGGGHCHGGDRGEQSSHGAGSGTESHGQNIAVGDHTGSNAGGDKDSNGEPSGGTESGGTRNGGEASGGNETSTGGTDSATHKPDASGGSEGSSPEGGDKSGGETSANPGGKDSAAESGGSKDTTDKPADSKDPTTSTPRSTTPIPGEFSVQDGQIIGPDGKPFIAKGIADYGNAADHADQILKNFPDMNILRLAVSPGQDSMESIQKAIDIFTAKGIVVEVEDHHSAGGENNTYTGDQLKQETDWYAQLAAANKDNSYVWFGTANEPNSANPQEIVDQEVAIYNAIRGAGNNNMIMLELQGGGSAQPMQADAGAYANMTNVAWDGHYYGWVANYQSGPDVAAKLQEEIDQAQQVKSADGLVPFIIGEYGDATDGRNYDANAQDVLDSVQASGHGSIAWAWNNAGLQDTLTDGNGNLSALGQDVADYINA